MNIYQKLLEVKKTVEFLKKEAAGAQYKYNPSSQVLLAVRDKMNGIGLFLEMRIIKHTVHLKSEGGLKENFTELDLEMVWVNVEKPDERIIIPWAGQGVDARETGLGKSLTYAEKYFLLKQFNIPTDKDDPDGQPENQARQSNTQNNRPAATETSQQPRTDKQPNSEPPSSAEQKSTPQNGLNAKSRVMNLKTEMKWDWDALGSFASDVLGRSIKKVISDIKTEDEWKKVEDALLVTKQSL